MKKKRINKSVTNKKLNWFLQFNNILDINCVCLFKLDFDYKVIFLERQRTLTVVREI